MAFLTSSVRYSSEKWYYEIHKPLQWNMNDFYHYRHTKNFQPEESANDFHDISFDSIMHATHTGSRNLILKDDDPEFAHFKAHTKIGYENVERLDGRNFLWFSPFISLSEVQKVQWRMDELISKHIWGRVPEHLKEGEYRIANDDERRSNYSTNTVWSTIEELSNEYGKSPAMRMDASRYGPHGFIIPFAKLLKCMAVHHGVSLQDLVFYDMGTFTYYKEQMHTILICPREDFFFKPMLDDSKIFCRPKSEDDKYHWFVRSTQNTARQPRNTETELGLAGSYLHVDRECHWEHLSFACLLQPDQELLIPRGEIKCKLLKHDPKDCIPAKRTATKTCPDQEIQNDRDPLQDVTRTRNTNVTDKRTIDQAE